MNKVIMKIKAQITRIKGMPQYDTFIDYDVTYLSQDQEYILTNTKNGFERVFFFIDDLLELFTEDRYSNVEFIKIE